MFFLLDVDNSGSLSIDEFIKGVQKMKGPAQGADMILLLSYVQRASKKALALQNQADKLIAQANTLLERLDDMWGVTESELYERKYVQERQKELASKVSARNDLISKLALSQQRREDAVHQPVARVGAGGDPE